MKVARDPRFVALSLICAASLALCVSPAAAVEPVTVHPIELSDGSILAGVDAIDFAAEARIPYAAAIAPLPADELAAQARDAEVRLVAATVYAEARSEGPRGMRAVAHVIFNRVGGRFGATVRDVILAPFQFSAWNRNDPNRPIAENPEAFLNCDADREAWDHAQAIARDVIEGRSIDPTGGARFYHTRSIRPRWAAYGVGRQRIGAHVFYRDVLPRRRRA